MLSIIVPIYNVADYLASCLRSIQQQTYTDFEVVMVDDGSTDESALIAAQWVQQDVRFRLVNQANGGCASARNHGLALAQGEYITFIDSDDYYQVGTILAEAVTLLEQSPTVDVVEFGIKNDYGQKATYYRANTAILTHDQLLEAMLCNRISTSACNKVYRQSAIQGICFGETAVGEDQLFLGAVYLQIKQLQGIETIGYVYRHQRQTSLTKTVSSKMLAVLEVKQQLLQQALAYDPNLARYQVAYLAPTIMGLKNKNTNQLPQADRQRINQLFRQYVRAILKDPYVGKKTKLNAVLALCGLDQLAKTIQMKWRQK